MKITGIIAEYNPFHNGHELHIQKARALTGADYIIVVMSGDFTQRGLPAIMNKYTRAQNALTAGADLVLELPCVYATGSAPYFAMGGVSLLDKLGCVDTLFFGSESGDLKIINAYASYSPSDEAIKEAMKNGMTYPAALEYVSGLDEKFPKASPNDLLAAAYCKALKSRESAITPKIIKREGASYGEKAMTGSLSSATAIRLLLETDDTLPDGIKSALPTYVYKTMEKEYGYTFPIMADDFSMQMYYKLRSEEENGYTEYLDVSREISDRISKLLPTYTSFLSFCEQLKTKNITYTRACRSLLHIFLNIKKTDMKAYEEADYIPYARILGFRKESSPLLSEIAAHASLQLISKLADAPANLDAVSMKMLSTDLYAADLYRQVLQCKFHTTVSDEYRTEIIRL